MSYCLNPSCQNPTFNPVDTKFCLICGTNLLLDNRYRATELLGAGGMGRNFLAMDERTPSKKRCVIKQFFPAPQILNNPTAYQKAVELFNREAATLDTLGDESSKIPRLLANIEQDKRLYFVQEFIDGKNLLQELQQQGTYNESQILQLLTELLPALKFIHERSVIHRDIKPENIMRRRDGELLLIDFGISKELSGTVMSIGTTVGTVGYAPPEQMTYGESYPASDIYALGATCIHLLTNTFPHLLYNPQEQRWTWREVIASQGKSVSNQLAQILDKMLQQDIRQRYQSADAVLIDLQPNPTLPVSTPQKITPPTPSPTLNYKLRNFIGIVITIVVGLTIYKFFQPSVQSPPSTIPSLGTQPSNSPSPSLSDSSALASKYYEQGRKFRQEGNNQAALEQYNKAIELNPKYANAYVSRGIVRDDLNDKQGALQDYNQAIELDPQYAIAYYNRGIVRDDLSDEQGALKDYNQAIELDPKYVNAYINRGIVRKNLGDKQGALQDYNQAIALDPKDADAYYNRGNLRKSLGDKQIALKDYNQAIALNPKYALAYYGRGIVRNDLGDKQGAIQDYNQTITLNPKYVDAYYARGNVRDDLGEKQGALQDFNQAIELDPKYVNAYINRGIVRKNLGDKQGALQDYNQAIALNPQDGDAYYNRGSLRKILGDKQSAINDYNQAAILYQQQRKTKDYQDAIEQINKLSPQ
ncbi:TPR domain protein [Calothrix sp. NIES-2100]|uniref:tetratricopeptide repeat protein n=1 Tax=Calothrix sp. NIES-2100 TaxID=1954172 RepID=UPI000B6171D3|nr:TPR domain protein [Calothrix sp. NIES-2100]